MKEKLIPYIGQSFECVQCGECCHCRIVPLTISDIERIKIIREDYLDNIEYNISLKNPVLSRREWDSGCYFLTDNKCSIHDHKPMICRLFPFAVYFDKIDENDKGAEYVLSDGKKIYLYIDTSCPGVDSDKIEKVPDWIIALTKRIRIEKALTRSFYEDIHLQ